MGFAGGAIRVQHVVPLESRAALGTPLLAQTEQVVAAVQAVEMIERYEVVPHKLEVALRAARLASSVSAAPAARALDVVRDEAHVRTVSDGTLSSCGGSFQPAPDGVSARLHDRIILRGCVLTVKPAGKLSVGKFSVFSYQSSVRKQEGLRSSN